MITAKWKQGFGSLYKTADANKVAQEIIGIGESATPQQILDKARSKKTELHKCFEWDDTVAAEKWRLQQARFIVCHLVIEEEEVPTERPEVRMFYKTEPAHDSGYKQTRIIMAKEDDYKALLAKAWSELRAFKAKYQMLTELAEIFALID